MNMDIDEYDKIRGIVNESMAILKSELEKDVHAGFELLNNTLSEKIKSRVSDTTCQIHREKISEEKNDMRDRITILETTKKITNAALYLLIPIAILGIVYGVITYQKVEDLREKLNSSIQIVQNVDV